MFKSSQKISISKHFLIPLLFIVLIFASFGANMDDVCAHDLNQSADGISSELNIEDKLENSQENILNTNVESDEQLSAGQNEILGITPTGNTFQSINDAIEMANEGETIKLSGTYYAQRAYDQIKVTKKITFTADSSATLDGKGLTQIVRVEKTAGGSSFNNIKFINAYFDGTAGALFIRAPDVHVTNCVFENNTAYQGSGISTTNSSTLTRNLLVENCRFINNYAKKTAGALSAYANNTRIVNCIFDSNRVYNGTKFCYGGAIQIGLDGFVSQCYVYGCKFYNNYVEPVSELAHGGAGCVREGTVYENCIFTNNSAGQGGALTYHGSGIIKNCSFTNNKAYYYGGALSTGYNYTEGNLKIENCFFKANNAPIGGAVQLMGENIKISKCDFNDNRASQTGGAINIDAGTVNMANLNFNRNVANIDGGAVFINGKSTSIKDSSFYNNDAIPDVNKLNDGLGGAIYINSTQAFVEYNEFYFNTARNGSAIYYDKCGNHLKLTHNTFYQNQAWVYALPIYAEDIYYGDVEKVGSVIHGGNNIAKYGNLAVSNAIYNAADNNLIKIDGEIPVLGATDSGQLYQDDREYNMKILLTVVHEDGTVVYNKTLNSDCFGEVKDNLNNLKPGKYRVTAKHYEDTYYKAITNTTTFNVIPKVDDEVKKSVSSENINYNDVVVWTLNIANNGPCNATCVVVRDVLPEGLQWIEDDTHGKYNHNTGVLNIGSLKVGEVYVAKIMTQVKKTGELINKVNITANEHDFNLANNHAQSKINVDKASDLAVVKSANVSTLNLHDLVKWTITVSNNGPDTATGVVAYDLLPKSLIWISDDSLGKYNHNTGKWDIGTLNKAGSTRLNIVCRVNATGSIENKVSVTGNEYDWDKSNNNAAKTINVNPGCDLGIVKSVSQGVVNYKDAVCWTLTVTNHGPDAATGVKIYETLPNGFVYLNSTRPLVNGAIDIGNLASGSSVSIKIYSRAEITGTFVNVASVKGNEYDHNPSNNRATASVVVKPATDLMVAKSVNNTSPNYGETIEWTITVKNNGPNTATGVIVSDILPKTLKFIKSNGNYDKNTGKWDVGTLSKGSSASLKITCTVNATGSIENKVSVTGNEYDWDKSNNNASKTVNVAKATDLGIVKSVSKGVANYGDTVCWTLTVSNHGPDAATGVKIYETLPNGFVYLNSTKPLVNGVIEIGNLAAGGSVNVKIYSRVNVTGTFVNVASVKGNEYDHNPSNNRATASIAVKPASDLTVTKVSNASDVNLHDLVKWTITVSNKGPDAATGVVVKESLPKSLIWISDDAAGKYNHDSGVWNVGNLNKSSSAKLNIVCRVNATGPIKNSVSVTGNEFDIDKSNNNDTKTVKVAKASDLGIVKVVNPSTVNYTDVVCWTLTVTNYGPDAATGVKIYETLPNGFVYLNSTKPLVNGVIDIGSLAVGGSFNVKIYSRVNVTGTFVNVASVKGNEYDQNLSNNKGSASITVKPASNLKVVKSVSNSKPNFADIIKWTITVSNNGPDMATGVVVKESLPKSMIWLSDDASGKYNHNTGLWNVGNINGGEKKTLTITTRVNGTGPFVNNVSVTGNEFDWNKTDNNDSVPIKVANASDLSVIKLTNQSVVDYRHLVKWSVIVKNNGPDKATGVIVEEILPEGLELINCTVTKGFYDNGLWSVCCLEKGEIQTMELICFVNKTGKLTNIVKIDGNEYDHNMSNNENNATVLVPKSSDLKVVKNVDNSNPNFGEIIQWTITVTNNGPDGSDDVLVIDELPEGLELVDYRCSSGNYGEGMWHIDYLDNGASESLVIRTIVKTLEDIENIAKVVPSQYDWDESNNRDNASVSVNPLADLSLIKLVNVSAANYLDLVKWTLIVSNNGPNDASGVFVYDVMPKGLKIVDAYGDGDYENSVWHIGDLANGQSKSLDIICKIISTGQFVNTASVWGDEMDPELDNNRDESNLFVYPASDLSITKTVSKYKYTVGDVVNFSIRLTNRGPDAAENVKVREIMDDSLKLLSFHASAGDFDKVNDVWSLDLLDAGQSAYLTVKAIAREAGIAKNSVVASSDNFDYDLSNNNDTVSLDIAEKQTPKQNPNVTPENNGYKHSDGEIRDYAQSILQTYKSGNPIMLIVLLFVFSLGAFYGNNILKKR